MAQGSGVSNVILVRFRAGALERIERLETMWSSLASHPRDHELASAMGREVHTLKGEARIVGYPDVDDLCHALEDMLAVARGRGPDLPPDFDLVVTMAFRFLAMLVTKSPGAHLAGIDLPGFLRQAEALVEEARAIPIAALSSRPPLPISDAPIAPNRLSKESRLRLGAVVAALHLAERDASPMVRLRLDEARARLSAELAQVATIPLEEEIAHHLAATEELARELGKSVSVSADFGDVRVSPEIASAVGIALLHLLRNSVDHGVESALDRARLGKLPVGRIAIRARDLGSSLSIEFEDDGRGIDWERVRERATARRLLNAREAFLATHEDLTKVLFRPGFSTAESVTAVSGRGVGLDAVRDMLVRVGGEIAIAPESGSFAARIEVPKEASVAKLRLLVTPREDVRYAIAEDLDAEPLAHEAGALESDAISLERALGLAESLGHSLLVRVRVSHREHLVAATLGTDVLTAARPAPSADDALLEIVTLDDAPVIWLKEAFWASLPPR